MVTLLCFLIDAVGVAILNSLEKAVWPAPGSEDTELGVLMELEVGHGETEVYARVQALARGTPGPSWKAGAFNRWIEEERRVQVFVRDNNVDQALKVLKKKMQREGIFREMRLRLRAGGGRIITRLQFLTSARSKVVLNSNSARSAFPLIDTAATTEDGSKPTSATMSMTIAGLRTYERPTAWLGM
jgi:ribosomal S21-like protein